MVTTEGRPNCDGYQTAAELSKVGIPVTLVLDNAVGYIMEKIDLVLMGAEGVLESGGIINKVILKTYYTRTIALFVYYSLFAPSINFNIFTNFTVSSFSLFAWLVVCRLARIR